MWLEEEFFASSASPFEVESGAPVKRVRGSAGAEKQPSHPQRMLLLEGILPHSAFRPPMLPAFSISKPDQLPFSGSMLPAEEKHK
jgi:hypothetical protein